MIIRFESFMPLHAKNRLRSGFSACLHARGRRSNRCAGKYRLFGTCPTLAGKNQSGEGQGGSIAGRSVDGRGEDCMYWLSWSSSLPSPWVFPFGMVKTERLIGCKEIPLFHENRSKFGWADNVDPFKFRKGKVPFVAGDHVPRSGFLRAF